MVLSVLCMTIETDTDSCGEGSLVSIVHDYRDRYGFMR